APLAALAADADLRPLGDPGGDADLHLAGPDGEQAHTAADRLLDGDVDVLLHVQAASRRQGGRGAAPGAEAGPGLATAGGADDLVEAGGRAPAGAEEGLEEVTETRGARRPRAGGAAPAEELLLAGELLPVGAQAVVLGPLLGVLEDLVGLVDPLEARLG